MPICHSVPCGISDLICDSISKMIHLKIESAQARPQFNLPVVMRPTANRIGLSDLLCVWIYSESFYISPLYLEYFPCPSSPEMPYQAQGSDGPLVRLKTGLSSGQTSIYYDIMGKIWKISGKIFHVCSIYHSKVENYGRERYKARRNTNLQTSLASIK